MQTIIRQVPLAKTISAEQLAILTDLELYVDERRTGLEQQQLQAEQELSELKQQLQYASDERLTELTTQLAEENRSQVVDFFAKMEHSLSGLMQLILAKLGINNYSPAQISQLIRQELSEILSGQQIVIKLHPAAENELRESLVNVSNKVVFHQDSSLAVERCILEFELAVIHINIAECKEAILKIIAPISEKELANE